MEISYHIILIGALLLVISILATSFFSRIGMPLLFVFLIIGMLAGEQGPGKILFQDVQNAHLIGVFALAVILLDAGLNTRSHTVRAGLLSGLSLASIGIVITSVLVASFATWLFSVSWLEGLLMGAILAPTDAVALFSLLHATQIKLKPHVGATLEIESGTNDPVAVLMTISLIQLLLAEQTVLLTDVFKKFLLEIGLGATLGIIAGHLIVWINNRIKLEESLYPLLVFSSAMGTFGATQLLGGSGYLALYLTGMTIGNHLQIQHHQNILRLHDSLAWISHIGMFLMLGLLVKPSALFPTMLNGLLMALVLIIVIRPIAVFVSLFPFKFSWREKTFVAWTGLRGAVPIILAINPLLVGLTNAELYFNVTFFLVVISIILQGWPLPKIARWFKVEVDSR